MSSCHTACRKSIARTAIGQTQKHDMQQITAIAASKPTMLMRSPHSNMHGFGAAPNGSASTYTLQLARVLVGLVLTLWFTSPRVFCSTIEYGYSIDAMFS
jgi:hypothetical protein